MKMTKVTTASRTASIGGGTGAEYVVKSHDTLEGIAARYDCTPTQLLKMNKLASRLLFPGQKIYVPDPRLQESPQQQPLVHKSASETSEQRQESTATTESVFSSLPIFDHGSASASTADAASNGTTSGMRTTEGNLLILI